MPVSTRRAVSTKAKGLSDSVRIVTYNVLSSNLAAPSWFLACKPENLDASNRLKKIKTKLKIEMENDAVICIQEISAYWAGSFHTFFSQHNYHLITGLYGNRMNGYMGVAVAVPLKKYEIRDVNITRIADTKRTPKKIVEVPSFIKSLIKKIIQTVSSFLLSLVMLLKLYKPPLDVWDNALYRTNQMVCCRLYDREQEKEFVVGKLI
jgi:mRNA deadenylase 3'-5' endonuclease subunit Ccr4